MYQCKTKRWYTEYLYILLRSKSTFLNRSRGHLSLCCYRCFINVLALNFFFGKVKPEKKWSMCVCIDHRLLLCASFSRYGKETTKYYTTLADLNINFHYHIMVVYLYFFIKLGEKNEISRKLYKFFLKQTTYSYIHT